MELDVVRGNPGLRRPMLYVEEPDARDRCVPFKSAKSLDGGWPQAWAIAERARLICAFFAELRAPLQLVSGNSTIIVLAGELGTPITR
jgi:hypothetical protein